MRLKRRSLCLQSTTRSFCHEAAGSRQTALLSRRKCSSVPHMPLLHPKRSMRRFHALRSASRINLSFEHDYKIYSGLVTGGWPKMRRLNAQIMRPGRVSHRCMISSAGLTLSFFLLFQSLVFRPIIILLNGIIRYDYSTNLILLIDWYPVLILRFKSRFLYILFQFWNLTLKSISINIYQVIASA